VHCRTRLKPRASLTIQVGGLLVVGWSAWAFGKSFLYDVPNEYISDLKTEKAQRGPRHWPAVWPDLDRRHDAPQMGDGRHPRIYEDKALPDESGPEEMLQQVKNLFAENSQTVMVEGLQFGRRQMN
jgi:hypothetical protein